MSNGREVYIAYRKQAEISRGGEKTISEAMQKGVAAWGMEPCTLTHLRTYGVHIVGIQTKETGDLYLSTLADFLAAPLRDYSKNGRNAQRYLQMDRFNIQLGSVRKTKSKL